MVIDLKFSRFESAPWGFRLVGGSDFDVPLTVIKVTEGSIAEQVGLRVGDVIVRINDEPTSWMTHNDAHDVIMRAGNNFFFGVIRGDEENSNQNNQISHEEIQNQVIDPVDHTPISIEDFSNKSHVPEEVHQQNETPSVDLEHHNTDDEIAEIMSGQGEVPEDQNVVPPGVNLYRVFPKPGVCMSSEVLRTLNDEITKTTKEQQLDKHKWTTFLQKPNRPIPKSKKELEEEAKRIPYVVKIVKQPKPRVAPDRPPSPIPSPVVEPEPEPQPKPEEIPEEPKKEEILDPVPNDSEVPDLEQINTSKVEIQSEVVEEVQECKAEVSEEIIEQHIEKSYFESSQGFKTKTQVTEKTAEEIALEKQLADVQKQLLALSSLPSTIQATLDAVTKQLSELLPTFRLQPSPVPKEDKIENDPDAARRDKETAEMMKICQERIMRLSENKILEIPRFPPPLPSPSPITEKLEYEYKEQEHIQFQDELAYKKQKERNLISELEQKQRSLREHTPRKSKKLFGPLTPQERPLVLPGGRRWRKPKDAYNDEFIAEVLSSQAELIVGSTLGKTSESTHLGNDERHYSFIALSEQLNQRVNFLKYQKPEKKIDLEKSEVYRVVHHLDREPRRGIEVRPPKVLAAEDIRPISCN